MNELLFDQREIKCACTNPDCVQSGISFDYFDVKPVLNFHFSQIIKTEKTEFLRQITKSMILSRETRDQLIKELKSLEFPKTKKTK